MDAESGNGALNGLAESLCCKHIASKAAVVGHVHCRSNQKAQVRLPGCSRGRVQEPENRRMGDKATMTLDELCIEARSAVRF
jgi:hypothetical protein